MKDNGIRASCSKCAMQVNFFVALSMRKSFCFLFGTFGLCTDGAATVKAVERGGKEGGEKERECEGKRELCL